MRNLKKNNPIMEIDLKEHFPDVYQSDFDVDPNDTHEDYYGEGKATLKVYPYVSSGDSEIYSHIDPSFNTGKIKLKLVVDTTDELHYGSESIIYIGLNELTEEEVLNWFGDLLNDPNRDYLSS